jgi:hypothetical protein
MSEAIGTEQDHDTYLGTARCGCSTLAYSTYGSTEKAVRRELAEYIRGGYTLEKLPADEVRKRMEWDCPHTNRPKHTKPEVEAEVDRLVQS